MSLKCKVGIHVWRGCKCASCGKSDNSRHDWKLNCEMCSVCLAVRSHAHHWNGCKCTTCGMTRESGHDWSLDCWECSVCRSKRYFAHDFDGKQTHDGYPPVGGVCRKCYKHGPDMSFSELRWAFYDAWRTQCGVARSLSRLQAVGDEFAVTSIVDGLIPLSGSGYGYGHFRATKEVFDYLCNKGDQSLVMPLLMSEKQTVRTVAMCLLGKMGRPGFSEYSSGSGLMDFIAFERVGFTALPRCEYEPGTVFCTENSIPHRVHDRGLLLGCRSAALRAIESMESHPIYDLMDTFEKLLVVAGCSSQIDIVRAWLDVVFRRQFFCNERWGEMAALHDFILHRSIGTTHNEYLERQTAHPFTKGPVLPPFTIPRALQ